MKTLYIVMKDRAQFNKTEIVYVRKLLKQLVDFLTSIARELD